MYVEEEDDEEEGRKEGPVNCRQDKRCMRIVHRLINLIPMSMRYSSITLYLYVRSIPKAVPSQNAPRPTSRTHLCKKTTPSKPT